MIRPSMRWLTVGASRTWHLQGYGQKEALSSAVAASLSRRSFSSRENNWAERKFIGHWFSRWGADWAAHLSARYIQGYATVANLKFYCAHNNATAGVFCLWRVICDARALRCDARILKEENVGTRKSGEIYAYAGGRGTLGDYLRGNCCLMSQICKKFAFKLRLWNIKRKC